MQGAQQLGATGAQQVGSAGAQQVGSAGAQQVGSAGAQQVGSQHGAGSLHPPQLLSPNSLGILILGSLNLGNLNPLNKPFFGVQQPSSLQGAGALQLGSHGAGAQQLGSHAAGAQQVGSHAAGAQQVGSHGAGAGAQQVGSAGAQQVGSQAAGAQQVGSAGAQHVGSGEQSLPQPLLLLPNRPNRPASALLDMVNTTIAAVKVIPFIVSLLLTTVREPRIAKIRETL